MNSHIKYILFFLFVVSTSFQTIQSLESIEVGKLPKAICRMSSYYDESSDTIYFFGGLYKDFFYVSNYDIYSFSLSTNIVTKIAEIPDILFDSTIPVLPSTSANSSNIIYYLVPHRDDDHSRVFKFNITDGSSTQIGSVPFPLDDSAWVKDPNGNDFFFFGGKKNYQAIIKVNLESETVKFELVGSLPQPFPGPRSLAVGNKAFIFGGARDEDLNLFPHITVDLESLKASEPLSTLPNFEGNSNEVKTKEDEIYLIGGYSTGQPVDGILRMNATTEDYEFLPIENIPLNPGTHYVFAPTSVYVEKLNRIYFFGGMNSSTATYPFLDNIWYIDID